MKNGHKFERTEIAYDSVQIKLTNGIVLHISSNPGYFHIDLCGIGDNPIEVVEQSMNGLNLRYKVPE
jgi:hypothetical protein